MRGAGASARVAQHLHDHSVGNTGDGPTSGTVTVTDTLEPGLTLNGPVTGTGWACGTSGATITCTRSDPLAAGSDYPPISIPVLVSAGAQPGQLSNTASLQAPRLATRWIDSF